MFSVCSGGCSDRNSLKGVNIYIYNSFTLQAWSVSPVQVEFVRQHPPVVAAGLRSVQTPAQLLPDGQRDPEGVRTHQCGDVTGRIQERRVDALRVLHTQITDSYTYIYILMKEWCGNADLRQGGVELEDLSLALHLSHTQLAGQLERGGAEALQGEGAVQVPLRAAPHLLEGKLLRTHQPRKRWILTFHFLKLIYVAQTNIINTRNVCVLFPLTPHCHWDTLTVLLYVKTIHNIYENKSHIYILFSFL